MKEINTIGDLVEFVQNDLAPRVDKVGKWAKVAAVGAFIGGLSTLGMVVLEIIKMCRG